MYTHIAQSFGDEWMSEHSSSNSPGPGSGSCRAPLVCWVDFRWWHAPCGGLLEVLSSRWKQLRAADGNPKLGAGPAERNGAAAPASYFTCCVCVFESFCWYLTLWRSCWRISEILEIPFFHKYVKHFILIDLIYSDTFSMSRHMHIQTNNTIKEFCTALWNIRKPAVWRWWGDNLCVLRNNYVSGF